MPTVDLENMDKDIREKVRLYNRLLISYNDFKQANDVATHLIENELYANYPRENRILVIALNCTVIVSYSRPFKKNKGGLAEKSLTPDVLDGFSKEEMTIHNTILHDRDTMMAHSDSDANRAFPIVVGSDDRRIVVPMNASPYANPLLPEVMEIVADMSYRLQEEVFRRRGEMEPELIDHLPMQED